MGFWESLFGEKKDTVTGLTIETLGFLKKFESLAKRNNDLYELKVEEFEEEIALHNDTVANLKAEYERKVDNETVRHIDVAETLAYAQEELEKNLVIAEKILGFFGDV